MSKESLLEKEQLEKELVLTQEILKLKEEINRLREQINNIPYVPYNPFTPTHPTPSVPVYPWQQPYIYCDTYGSTGTTTFPCATITAWNSAQTKTNETREE